MFKKLVMLLAPSGKTLAGYAAQGIAKSVNDSDASVREKIQKYSAYAAEATNIANKLARMAADGTIDEAETKELQEMLAPIFTQVMELI